MFVVKLSTALMVSGSLEEDDATAVHMFMFVEEYNQVLLVLGNVCRVG